MKTIIYQSLAIAVALILSGSNALAVDGRLMATLATNQASVQETLGSASGDNQIVVTISKGVGFVYSANDNYYVLSTAHMSGNREYATAASASTSSGIYWKACNLSDATAACSTAYTVVAAVDANGKSKNPVTPDAAWNAGSGWSAL